MHENSGIDSPFDDLLDNWFGKWKGSDRCDPCFINNNVFCAVALCGCCCIPCIRSLCNRVIVAAIEKTDQAVKPPPYQMPLLPGDDGCDIKTDVYEDDEDEAGVQGGGLDGGFVIWEIVFWVYVLC